jgi:hypothetical protein
LGFVLSVPVGSIVVVGSVVVRPIVYGLVADPLIVDNGSLGFASSWCCNFGDSTTLVVGTRCAFQLSVHAIPVELVTR